MAISYIGSAAAEATSCTPPTHTTGDLFICAAYRDGNTTSPSLPSGWTSIVAAGSNTNSLRVAWKFASSASDTCTGWTNASGVMLHVYRGANTTNPIGNWGPGTFSGTGTTINYTTLDPLSEAGGSSWVAAFAGHRSTNTTAMGTAPSGMTNRTNTAGTNCDFASHDTNGGVTGWAGASVNVGGTSSGYRYVDLEILAETVPTLTGQTVTQVSITEGTPKVTTNKASGTVYMVCVPDGDTPSVAQIKAGQNSSSGAAIADESMAVTASGLQTFSDVTGLTTDTPYDFWFVHNTSTGDSSAVKANFTPADEGGGGIPTDTGWLSPGGNTVGTLTTAGFTNPGNAYASDDTYATGTLVASSGSLIGSVFHTFNANIPAGSAIDGIEVRFEAKLNVTDVGAVMAATLVVDGDSDQLIYTLNFATGSGGLLTSTDTMFTEGSTSGWSNTFWGDFTLDDGDTYTYTPTRADINGNAFGVKVLALTGGGTNRTISLDVVQMKVYYTPPPVDSNTALFWAFP